MKILHTADWHLGRKTDDLDRTEEIKEVLNQVVKIANEENVDMVLIAGDIYDSLVPSAEAENLFFNTISELSNSGNRAVVAIAGNHDDPKRLSNAGVFSSNFNIYLVGYYDEIKINKDLTDRNIYPIDCGKGYIKFKKKNEEVVVVCLPYPSFYRYKETKKEGEDLKDKIKDWLSEGVGKFKKSSINILTSHILSYGEDMTDEEREEYSHEINGLFPFIEKECLNYGANYVALGHLHQPICVSQTNNIYYSGSLIHTHFSPKNLATKSVNIIDLNSKGIKSFKKVPLNVKNLLQISATSLSEVKEFCLNHPTDYIKAIITTNIGINYEELKLLRKDCVNLVTISVLNNQMKFSENFESKKDLTTGEIFDKFVEKRTGKLPDNDVKELFLELMGENVYEAD